MTAATTVVAATKPELVEDLATTLLETLRAEDRAVERLHWNHLRRLVNTSHVFLLMLFRLLRPF